LEGTSQTCAERIEESSGQIASAACDRDAAWARRHDAEAGRVRPPSSFLASHREGNSSVKKLWRNIFTLGIGEAFDWGGLNRIIEAAEHAARVADEHKRQSEADLAAAHTKLSQIRADIEHLASLKDTLKAYDNTLSDEMLNIVRLVEHVQHIQNLASETSLFLSDLDAQASTFFVQRTAIQLERKVGKLQLRINNFKKTIKDTYPNSRLLIAYVPPGQSAWDRMLGLTDRLVDMLTLT
jgi:hypothetical protein